MSRPAQTPEPAALIEPCPCDDCAFAERCRGEYLACRAFAMFTHGFPERQWSDAAREPDAQTYQRLMACR